MPPPVVVLGSVVSLQGGATLARSLFPLAGVAGVAGVVALRLGFGAIILTGLHRPRLRMDRRAVALVALGRYLRLAQGLGVAAIVAASIGASLGRRQDPPLAGERDPLTAGEG